MDKFVKILTGAFRLFALFVLLCLLVFPAFKGVWLGYVPILAAFGLWLVLLKSRSKWEGWLANVPEWWFLAGLLILQVVAQVILVLVFRPVPELDSTYVFNEAKRLCETGHLSPLTYYAPAQTWWYMLCFKALGASALTAQLSHVPLISGTLVLLYIWAKYLAGPIRARQVALAYALYPSTSLYLLTTPYYHYLYTFLLLATAFFWWMTSKPGQSASRSGAQSEPSLVDNSEPISGTTMGYAFAAGLAAAGAALTKAVMLIAPLQALAFWACARKQILHKKVWAWWLIFMLSFVLTLVPWTIRNYRVFGEWVPICTSGGLVLYSANNPESNGLYSPIPDQVKVSTAKEMLEHSRWCRAQAHAFIRQHPLKFLKLALAKNLYTWGTETTLSEFINFRGRKDQRLDRALSFVLQTGWALLIMAWVAWAIRRLRKRASATPIELLTAIIVLSNVLIYSYFEGGDRHHLPLVPLLILLIMCSTAAEPSAAGPSDRRRKNEEREQARFP